MSRAIPGLSATRCPHCGAPRACAPLADWEAVNRVRPLPGLAEFYRQLGRRIGPAAELTVCLTCACFEQVGSDLDHELAHMPPAGR